MTPFKGPPGSFPHSLLSAIHQKSPKQSTMTENGQTKHQHIEMTSNQQGGPPSLASKGTQWNVRYGRIVCEVYEAELDEEAGGLWGGRRKFGFCRFCYFLLGGVKVSYLCWGWIGYPLSV